MRHLHLLAALEEEGSLHAAARRLHLTPSALSQQLRELERQLGGALFHRGWRKLVPTAAGASLTARARNVLAELGRAEAEARNLIGGRVGSIRVATACYLSYRWLPSVLAAFERKCPNVEVTVLAEAAQAPLQWLEARTLDAAIVVDPPSKNHLLRFHPLFRDELVALVGRGHPWFGRKLVEIQAFTTQHFWGPEDALRDDKPLGRSLRDAAIAPRKVTLIPMTAGIPVEMARANLGVTVMARWAAESALLEGSVRAVRVGRRGLWLDWFVATRAEQSEAPLESFLDALRAHHPTSGRRVRRRSN